jgi:hypothetical protein
MINATSLVQAANDYGAENSDAIKAMMSGSVRVFFEHTIAVVLILIILVLAASFFLSYINDIGEGAMQTFLFAGTIYAVYMLILFAILIIIDTGESGVLSGLM